MPGPVPDVQMSTDLPPGLEKRLRCSAEESAATGAPDPDALAELRVSGLLATAVPREYGGHGGDAATVNRVVERLAYLDPSVAVIAFQHFAVTVGITEWGTGGQKAEFLPRLADGSCLAASSWSEPGTGAAGRHLGGAGIRRPDGSWALDGTGSFTTSASIADLYLVLVRTEEVPDDTGTGHGSAGQTFFLVEAGNPGLVPDLGLDLAGMRGSAAGFISLHRCIVADEARLGPQGCAARLIADLRGSGATLGAVATGTARAALDLLVEHLPRRGRIAAPTVRDRLVDLAIRVETARAVVERAGARSSADPGLATVHSKLHASTAAERICLEAARLLVATGCAPAPALDRLLADARFVALLEPSNDLCRDLVGATWTR